MRLASLVREAVGETNQQGRTHANEDARHAGATVGRGQDQGAGAGGPR